MAESTTNLTRSDPLTTTSPYYLGSSDNPGSVLVSNVFNGVGFSAWKRSMVIALSAKNKFSFVDGTIPKPAVDSSTYSAWYRVNSMVTSWILNSLSKNIADSVLFLPTACDIWNELNQRYEQSNGALIYQIQQQLYSISQNTDDFSTYYTKLTKIWDELRVIQEVPNCPCGTNAKILKFLEDQRLIQLLMGLNDSYKILRGQILMMKPLPSLSTAYSLIIHEECQREIHNTVSINNDAIAMQASSDSHSISSKKSLTCTHCKKGGHSKSQCYRLIGFPSNFKFTKSKKDESKSIVQNVTSSSSNITQEQYQQLIQLLNNNSPYSNPLVNMSITENDMHADGPFIEE